MPKASEVLYYLVHVQQLRSIIQWKVWHNPVHERDESKESPELKKCFEFLDLTSRSFASVIKELHPDLLIPICLFYLVLRGLDTIEDDTSIDAKTKEPLLRNFKDKLEVDGWNFNGNRPEEKDRELLVQFQYVIAEYKKQKQVYQDVIKDICDKMGNGMADYCLDAEFNNEGVKTVKAYDLYCHYVAGLVGEGLTRMFVESGFGNPRLLERPNLHDSMGLFLQKTNIIRDIREDFDDKRSFWPKEIWGKHVDKFEDLFKPEHKAAALACQSEMVLNALNHADECLFYLAGLREQSVFNFCAIPQTMAIATLELCFQNYAMFERNIKITKGEACQIMIESTQNLELVCERFRKHIRAIRKKNNPKDPNFLKISIACGKVEQFIESIFPKQTPESLAAQKEGADARLAQAGGQESTSMGTSDVFMLSLAVFGTLFIISAIMVGVAWLFGARFDLVIDQLKEGGSELYNKLINPNPDPPVVSAAKAITSSIASAASSIKKEL
ncbi:farnesyl-diphosphate farnesyltransferase [Cyphellophora europaea CBS 101466]|uniref:squalene synthase n=1 Tax=Cyphellophora europaea (strain CBS 101466) TaxID=1220924 RepID=W2RR79_CYPE1|nr:farnesyl-diphosphate farnesyltransferase [Cyphellophora europaea CBS 101466]ETN38239.1 farnesyl-diphosphate farnesyltransferase [Cyphellophora europaea CBS 101466]